MARLRIGIVGCGEAAQVIHLPALAELADLYELTALCDVSRHVVETLAVRHPGVAAVTNHRELVSRADVDAVLVANPHIHHAEVTLAALAAGKHVLVEKPLCVSLTEADVIAEMAQRTGLTVQVGYMRRYADAFLQAGDWVRERRTDLRYVRFQDIVGKNATIVADVSSAVRPKDLSRELARRFAETERSRYAEVIAHERPALAKAYGQLLGLVSHDISAMRELLGRPQRVLQAWQRHGGMYLGISFDYGDFVAEIVSGVDEIPRYDTFIEVFTAEEVLRLDYAPPYIRHVPARLTQIRASGPAGVETSKSFPSRADPFVAEWRAFHACVTKKLTPKTSIADSREDLPSLQGSLRHH